MAIAPLSAPLPTPIGLAVPPVPEASAGTTARRSARTAAPPSGGNSIDAPCAPSTNIGAEHEARQAGLDQPPMARRPSTKPAAKAAAAAAARGGGFARPP